MEETELAEYSTVHDLRGREGSEGKGGATAPSVRRSVLLAALLVLGLLCVLQAVLNVSLRLAARSAAEEAEQCHLEGTDATPTDSAQPEDACSRRLRALRCRYQVMETDRDRLQDQVSGLSQSVAFLQRELLDLQQEEGSSSSNSG